MKKNIILILFCLIVGHASAQPSSSYTLGTNLGNYTIARQASTGSCGTCSSGSITEYGFRLGAIYTWGDLVINTTNLKVTRTYDYVRRTITCFNDCSSTTGSATVVSSFTVTVEEIDWNTSSGSILPGSICKNSSSIDLRSYVYKATGSGNVTPTTDASITFESSHGGVSGNFFDPAATSVSSGTVTLTVKKIFTNGTLAETRTIDITPVTAVTANPAAQSACPSGSVSFSGSGSGQSIGYQWQYWNGSWQNLTDGTWPGYSTSISGSATATLTFTNLHRDFNGWQVRLAISGTCGTVYTSSASLTVHGQVSIDAALAATTNICPGASLNLSASATPRSGAISYTWQYKYPADAGYTDWVTGSTNTATAPASQAWQGLQIRYKAQDACGSVNENYSSATTVNVYDALSITQHPSDRNVCKTSSTTFTAASVAQNGSLTYQWQYHSGGSYFNLINGTLGDGMVVSGVTTGTLSLSNIPLTQNGLQVRCVINDACGSATSAASNAATLTVYSDISITSNPGNQTICPGSNAVYSVGVTTGNGAATYQWQVSTNSGSTWSNIANDVNHSGATSSSLTLLNVTSTWTGNFSALRYRCLIRDGCGAVSEVASSAATLALYSPVAIDTQPIDRTICPGGNTTFVVAATAQTGSLSYSWELSTNGGSVWSGILDGGVYSGSATNTLTLTGANATYNGYKYRVKVTDGCGAVNATYSTVVTLTTYSPVSITSNPPNRQICPSTNTTFSVSATAGNGALTYQWQESINGGSTWSNLSNTSLYSGVTTATLTLTSAPSTLDNNRYRVIVTDACGSVNAATSSAGILNFNTPVSVTTQPANQTGCAGGNVSFMAVASGTGFSYQWQESTDGGSSYSNLTNTGIFSGVTTNSLTLSGVTASYDTRRYRVVVTGSCNAVNSSSAVLTVVVPPAITVDPVSTTVCEGTAANFSVTASGSSLTYQWQYSSTGSAGTFNNISSATSSTYSISSTTLGNAGYYRAVVGNGCSTGTVSSNAQLTVNPVTAITTQPANASSCPSGAVNFTVSATGTGTLIYQWQISVNGGSTFTDLNDSGNYSGVTTSTLTISSISTLLNNNQYRVTVNGSCGAAVNSAARTLTVNPIPSSPVVADVARCGDGSLSSTASSSASSPTFKWYTNTGDVVPVYTGATYEVSNLTVTTSYFVSVTSMNCESAKEEVIYTRHSPQNVPLGGSLTLCQGQGLYNLENDISDANAKGSVFTWTANSTNFSSIYFDPSVGAGNYIVTYDPPVAAKATPHCYISTTRPIAVISSAGDGGIVFNNPLVSGGNTVNMCVGDNPVDIATFPSATGGTWSTVSGTGLSFSGNAVVFTPDANSYTAINPNTFRYTVSVGGCTATKDLFIYVKDNGQKPIVTGVPAIVCPDTNLSLSASVSSPGTYDFLWYKSGQLTPIGSGSTFPYTVTGTEVLQCRSVNSPFGCRSEATLVEIKTPFNSGSITVDKSLIGPGEPVKFSTDATQAGNTFNWKFGDGATSVEYSPIHFYYQLGDHIVELVITSTLGCSQTLTYNKITVQGDPIQIVTNVQNQKERFTVHPNPVNRFLFISQARNLELRDFELYDFSGRALPVHLSKEGNEIMLDVSDLPSGLYVLKLNLIDGQELIKINKN